MISSNTSITIRPYRPEDREAVRHVCCETGFMGKPIDPVFNDRSAFADFFTRYYTDWEHEHCLVAHVDGKVVGYLTGCIHYRRYQIIQVLLIMLLIPKVLFHLPRYHRQSILFLRWFIFRSFSEKPKSPSRSAHFHINVLPQWRTGVTSRRLIFNFLDYLSNKGVSSVYGQIQTYEDRRPLKIFERYGFSLYDQRQVTKFRNFYSKAVYVSTFCSELALHKRA